MGLFDFWRKPVDPYLELRDLVQQDADSKDMLNKAITVLMSLNTDFAHLGITLRERGSSAQDILKIQNAVWKLGFSPVDPTQRTHIGTPEQVSQQGKVARIRADSITEINRARDAFVELVRYIRYRQAEIPQFPPNPKPFPELLNDSYVSFRGTVQVKLQDFQDDFNAERLLDQHTVNHVFEEFNAKLSDTFLLIESTINRLRLLAMPPNT